MTSTSRPQDTDRLPDLRLLEPANTPERDRSGSPAAQKLLSTILSTDRAEAAPQSAGLPRRRGLSRLTARTGVLVAAAVAVTIGVVAVPALQGGSSAAFASWTPVPTPVPAVEAAALAEDCLAGGRALGNDGPSSAALTERRGAFTFTLVATDDAVGNCNVLDSTTATDSTDAEQSGYTWGSLSDLPVPTPGGTSVQWGSTFTSAAGEYTSAVGRVGARVTAVEITSGAHADVRALVGQGFFTAWWPGSAEASITVTTTLTDGRRITRQLRSGDR